LVDHPADARLIPSPGVYTPQLQESHSFKDNHRRVIDEFSLNRKFITDLPQSPGLCQKQQPKPSARGPCQARQNMVKLRKVRGVPIATQKLS
jgi:hypothetical protein